MFENTEKLNPLYADVKIDADTIHDFPENGVPDVILQCAVELPEGENIKTRMDGPSKRQFLYSDDAPQNDADIDSDADGELENPETPEQEENCNAEVLVGFDVAQDPEPAMLFRVLQKKVEIIQTEGIKLAKARTNQKEAGSDENIALTTHEVATKEHCRRVAIDAQGIVNRLRKLDAAKWERELLDAAKPQLLSVPTGRPLSMFEPQSWSMCFVHFFYGDAAPNLQNRPNKRITLEKIFNALLSREELEYDLPSDTTKYRASVRSRFDSPDIICIFADCIRRLRTLQAIRASFARKGFEQDLREISKITAQDFVECGIQLRENNQTQEQSTTRARIAAALRHLQFATGIVPLTSGYRTMNRHLGHAMNVAWGPLLIFMTVNLADLYHPVVLHLYNSEKRVCEQSASLTLPGLEHLADSCPNMPPLKNMHKICAQSPRSVAKFWLLLEDLILRHILGISTAFLGSFKIQASFSKMAKQQEDDLASSCTPGLAMFCQGMLAPLEDQGRGFFHCHRKIYGIPSGHEDSVKILFASLDPIKNNLDQTVQETQDALLQTASSLQYDSAILTARQLNVVVDPEPFSRKQQQQSRLDGGIEPDGSVRDHLPVALRVPLKHIAKEDVASQSEERSKRNSFAEVPLTGCELSVFPPYRLPQSFGSHHDEHTHQTELPWVFDQKGAFESFVMPSGAQAFEEDFLADSAAWSQAFAEDVRFLHSHCHNHNCSTTCVKYSKSLSESQKNDALQSHRVPLCRFMFYTIFAFHKIVDGVSQVFKRIRRRGKRLIPKAYVAATNEQNELGRACVVRTHPFISSSTDVGIACLRSNVDFQFLARAPPSDLQVTAEVSHHQAKLLASCYSIPPTSLADPLVKRCMYTLCALHLAAQNCDFYITKYQSKDLEQLANVVTQYALGIRRLEAEEQSRGRAEPQQRAKQICIKMAMAANRATWVSTPSLALFLMTGEYFVSTHHSHPLFLSRPMYLIQACKDILLKAATTAFVSEPPEESFWSAFQIQENDSPNAEAAAEETNCPENDEPHADSAADEADCAENDEDDEDDEDIRENENSPKNIGTATLRHNTGQFDDFLHRGDILADMNFYIYNSRIQRVLKSVAEAQHANVSFPFETHYPMSELYCQVMRQRTCIPRLIGRKCPGHEENEGEEYSAYKVMLFQPLRCHSSGHCNDPLLCKPCLFPTPTEKRLKPTFALAWKACRARMRILANKTEVKRRINKRLPVIHDTPLHKMWFHDPKNFTQQMLSRLTLEQVMRQKISAALLWHAHSLLAEFLGLETGYHDNQLFPDEFFAWQSSQISRNIDADMLAKKDLLKTKDPKNLPHIEDDADNDSQAHEECDLDVDCFGGAFDELQDETAISEDEQTLLPTTNPFAMQLEELQTMLARHDERSSANKPGPTPDRFKQMISFSNAFGVAMNLQTKNCQAHTISETQLFGYDAAAALQHQDAVLKLMSSHTISELKEQISEEECLPEIRCAANNLELDMPEPSWLDLPLLLQGPKKFAWHLCLQENLSDEQINCVALVAYPLQIQFEKRPDKSSPLIPTKWDAGMVRIVLVGSGGCGKSLLINKIFTPLFQAYFGFNGVLKQAPSNKAARLIGGRTMHVASALQAAQSLRTAQLKPNESAMKKLQILHVPAGADIFDEFSQIQAALLHANCLRTAYSRRRAYDFDINTYATSAGLFGFMPIVLLCGDPLQLPPVPDTTSLLSDLDKASSEHKAGCAIFSSIEDIFVFTKARRFTDQTLIEILDAMRKPGGQQLTDTQWEALQETEVDSKDSNFSAEQFLQETHGWYHVAYTWSLVSMASVLRAQAEARHAGKQILYVAASDTPKKICTPNLYKEMLQAYHVQKTKKIPSVSLFFVGQRVRFTATIQAPFAVQDATGVIQGIDLVPDDARAAANAQGDVVLRSLPLCIYVKLDNCEHDFLPSAPGESMAGVFAVKPLSRDWKFESSKMNFTCKVRRTGYAIMPASTCPLYSMQGTTATPGMVMHWQLPSRLPNNIRWLIVYVALSRVRTLRQLKSVGLDASIRQVIEAGPPEKLLDAFNSLFQDKPEKTSAKALEYRRKLGWPL